MAVAELHPQRALAWANPEDEEFLRLFGAICAVPSVGLVGMEREGGALGIWVRLVEDDEESEHRVYDAVIHSRSTGVLPPVELHVVFADEDDAAVPSDARIVFQRR